MRIIFLEFRADGANFFVYRFLSFRKMHFTVLKAHITICDV